MNAGRVRVSVSASNDGGQGIAERWLSGIGRWSRTLGIVEPRDCTELARSDVNALAEAEHPRLHKLRGGLNRELPRVRRGEWPPSRPWLPARGCSRPRCRRT